MAQRAQMDPKAMVGQQLYDEDGDPIGTVERLIVDTVTKDPEWLGVRLGSEDRIVPVPLGALLESEGERLVFYQDRSLVESAPQLDEVGEMIETEDEAVLYQHYGVARPIIKERAEAMGVEFTSDGVMLAPSGPAGNVAPPRPEGYPEEEWDIAYGVDPSFDINKAFAMAYAKLSHMEVASGEVIKIGWTGAGIPAGGGVYVILGQRQSSPEAYRLGRGEVDELEEDDEVQDP